MQPKVYNSRFLSPQQAVDFLQEQFGYKTSYRRISELMRNGTIQSFPEDDYSEHKLPRIRTTVAALEIWLETRFRDHSRAKGREQLNRASAHAALREAKSEAELASIPEQHNTGLARVLNVLGVPTEDDVQAAQQLAVSLAKAEARRLKKEQKKQREGEK